MRDDQTFDEGIQHAVDVLDEAGFEIVDACDGSPGHAYPEPTVVFNGDQNEGLRALTVALKAGLRVEELRRVWSVRDGEPYGPVWQLVLKGEDDDQLFPEPADGITH
jgi:hypothetical protein